MGNSEKEGSKSQLFMLDNGRISSVQADGKSFDKAPLSETTFDNKYQILGVLGTGGMGTVYQARHLMLDKNVALKTFCSKRFSEEDFLRFQREAQALAKVNHKNIIQMFDFGLSEDGRPYYTMELLKGRSIADVIETDKYMPIDQALSMAVQVCQGMDLAHSKGIIHRDIKPGNIFLEYSETSLKDIKQLSVNPKIIDFGLSSLTAQNRETQQLTSIGSVYGSPPYMSPEHTRGKQVTTHSDIYSMGCTLFEALTGNPPFTAESIIEIVMMQQSSIPPTLQAASGGRMFPRELEEIVAQMLSKSPNERQASMADVAKQLQQVKYSPIGVTTTTTAAPLSVEQPNQFSAHNASLAPNIMQSLNQTKCLNQDTADSKSSQNAKSKTASQKVETVASGKTWIWKGALLIAGVAIAAYATSLLINKEQQKRPGTSVKSTNSTSSTNDTQATIKEESTEEQSTTQTNEPTNNVNVKAQEVVPKVDEVMQTPIDPKVFGSQRTIVFPTGSTLGTLHLLLPSDLGFNRATKWLCLAQGRAKVQVPPETLLLLELNRTSFDDPSKLDSISQQGIDGIKSSILSLEDNGDDLKCNRLAQHISQFKNLQYLSFEKSSINDEGLKNLRNLSRLKNICLRMTETRGDCFVDLSKLPELTCLKADYCPLKQENLVYLASMPKLVDLSLSQIELSPEGVSQIANCASIKGLNIANNPRVDDSAIKHLNRLQHLTFLDLRGTGVTIEGLRQLGSLKLVDVILTKSSFTQRDMAKLHRLMPRTNLQFYANEVNKEQQYLFSPLK